MNESTPKRVAVVAVPVTVDGGLVLKRTSIKIQFPRLQLCCKHIGFEVDPTTAHVVIA